MPDRDPQFRQKIEFLVEQQFPRGSRHLSGASPSVAFQQLNPELQNEVIAAQSFYQKLEKMTPAAFDVKFQAANEKRRAEKMAEDERDERERYFNLDSATADFTYWAKADSWSLDEATALTLGRDPRVVKWEGVEPKVRSSKFAYEYSNLRELIYRGYGSHRLDEPVEPRKFLKWAGERKIEVDQRLLAEFEALEPKPTNNLQAQKDTKPANSKPSVELRETAKRSLLKLILGMAMKKYRFKPGLERQSTATNIQSDLAEVGIKIDVDTVLNWLKIAAEEIEIDKPN